MLRAFVGLIIQGFAFANFKAFVDHLASFCYQAYGNPNPHERRMILQKIDAHIRGAFRTVPRFQHDQLASSIMSTMASYPLTAAQLHLLGPEQCARHFSVFAPVIHAIAGILRVGPRLDAPPLPAAVQGRNVGAVTPRLDPLAEALRALQLPPKRDENADTPKVLERDGGCVRPLRDKDALEAPSGLERETRMISQLKDRNRTAYNCAVTKLDRARRRDSESDQAREWIKNFVRLPLWEADRPNSSLSGGQQRDKLRNARDTLNAAVAGHDEAKKILLSRYAIWLRNPEGPGMVLGIQGPPGNGKTTLVEHGLSSALGRPAETIDMGGVGDAHILRGDRSLWMGSSPGRIADCLMRTGTRRFILILEEVDKVTRPGVQHVISNLTDPNRNSNFEDSYFSGVPLDLSKAMIVCTFNETRNLDPALASRMGQIVETSALSDDDKTDIAKRFFIVEALKDANRIGEIVFNDRAVHYIVGLCRSDPGARRLKSYIERVVGAVNIAMIESEQDRYEVTEAGARRLCSRAGHIW
ncbi:ATP-dependent protease [Ilyonectria robusta]